VDARRIGKDEGRTRGWEINVMRCNEGGGAHRERECERERERKREREREKLTARMPPSATPLWRD